MAQQARASHLVSLREHLGALIRFADAERHASSPLPLVRKLAMWRHGFLSCSAALYGCTGHDVRDYVSDYTMFRAASLNGPYAGLITGKLTFEATMHRYLSVPRSLAFIDGGRVTPLLPDARVDSVPAMVTYAREHDGIVLKPVYGSEGKGIMVLRVRRDGSHLNGTKVRASDLETLIATLHGYLASEFILQAAYARGLFEATTNTVRVVTMVDRLTQEPFVPIAVHRIGTQKSSPVDNWARGGLSAPIDLETGTIGAAASPKPAGGVAWHSCHPDTGSQIAGIGIPHWPMVMQKLQQTIRSMPYLEYVGWDVVVTDSGFVVLEGNTMPGMNSLQVHRPLLTDPRVRRFFESHRLVRPRTGR